MRALFTKILLIVSSLIEQTLRISLSNKLVPKLTMAGYSVMMKEISDQITSQKIHRLIIWSYAKEKIMEKPFIGHGFFLSRYNFNFLIFLYFRVNYRNIFTNL